jgi:hypothetical protein
MRKLWGTKYVAECETEAPPYETISIETPQEELYSLLSLYPELRICAGCFNAIHASEDNDQ